MATRIRRLSVDEASMQSAINRDEAYDPDSAGQEAYLDLETGEFVWVYEEDAVAGLPGGVTSEENRGNRLRVERTPDRFLKMPTLTHGESHELLREFLDSPEYTGHEVYGESIGRWKKAVDQDTWYAFEEFRWQAVKARAAELLRQRGIIAEWQ